MAASLYDQLDDKMSFNYRDVPELKEFFVENVQKTGKRLGSGAFGVVEELTVGGTLYAGKTLHSTLLDAHDEGIDRIVERFISECKLMSQVRHPNIVQFMGLCLFHDSIHPSLVMEKLDLNLENILGTYSDIPLPLTVRILKDIIKGLVYLHGKSPPVIHCDLTARNVLVNKASMNAKIADLGNALMIDPTKLSNTLSRAPGTLPYMPPEAVLCDPNYDSMLDMFSFGHLGLFAVTQTYPRNLLPSTYFDPSTDTLKARSELERRGEYISILVAKFSKDHAVTKIIFQCLHNSPEKRPAATEVMKQLENAYEIEEDPYSEINLVDLIRKTGREANLAYSTLFSESLEHSPLKNRLEAIKNEEFGKLDIYRFHGMMKRKQDWRTHNFQIKNGFLKYFKSNTMDKPQNELDLSLVVCVSACPARDSTSAFHFEIHFSASKGSPWLLRAQSQDDRTCWMEAIQPGSSTLVRSSNAYYEMISPFTEGDRYSYASHVIHPPESAVIYDEPDITTGSHTDQVQEPPPAEAEYDEPIFMSPATTHKEADDDDNSKIYSSIPEELGQDDSYVEVTQTSPSAPRRITTVPKEMDSIAEVSLENLDNLDPKEAQLWMLLHMQKMVQKMEDVYGSSQPSSPRLAGKQPATKLRPSPKLYDDKAKVPTPPYSDSSPSSEAMKETDNEDIGSEPTRQDLYMNLDTTNEPITESPPPPIPPRTYQHASEKVDNYKSQTQRRVPSESKPDHSTSGLDTAQQSKTLPPLTKKSTTVAHPGPSPMLAQDVQVRQYQSRATIPVQQQVSHSRNQLHSTSVPGLRSVIRQKRETSNEEMICTLKASNRAIISDIASHLVTDDDESLYAPGKRPEWARARTQMFGLEPSLADLHQKALFLPRSTLDHLEEIGQGQYGMVFKGRYKRSEDSGYSVAIKTIKEYESEKEKDNFLKEMNIMSKLMHPNIVRLFGLVQQDEPWIVLEYLPHGDLKNFLKNNKKPTEKLVKYMLDIATGMHYISEKGLVHRDLAARNVMVSEDEICKVGDFGLLRELPKDDEIYVAKSKLAFPIRWMAPESLMKSEFSPASDVWSFGIVMWEMYNPTELPYGNNMNNTQVAIGVNQDLRLHIPEVYPPTVVKIMKACWQQSPSKRPSFLLIASLLTKVCFGAE